MAYCPKCGEFAGNNAFCSHCGAKIEVNAAPASTVSATSAPAADPYRPDVTVQADPVAAPEFPMKWHKFMIYFSLWAGGVLSILEGLACFSAMGGSAVGVVLGILCIAMGAWAIYVRFQLAALRTGAPKMLMIFLIVNAAIGLLNALGSGDTQSFTSVLASVAYAVWNWRYYTSRAELFVN